MICMILHHQSPGPRVSFTYGVAPLQLATPGAAALGVGGVVFLHGEDGGCLGNRWCSPVEGRGWHQSRGETLTGDIHRLRLLLQSAGGGQQAKHRSRTRYCYVYETGKKPLCVCQRRRERNAAEREMSRDLRRSRAGESKRICIGGCRLSQKCNRARLFAAARKLGERINRLIAPLLRVNLLASLCSPGAEPSLC